jgi:hypothetical protein
LNAWAWVIAVSVPLRAIPNQSAKEGKANFSVELEVLLALFVDQKQMVTLNLPTDIDIFSHFDITVGARMKARPSPHVRSPSGVNQSIRK